MTASAVSNLIDLIEARDKRTVKLSLVKVRDAIDYMNAGRFDDVTGDDVKRLHRALADNRLLYSIVRCFGPVDREDELMELIEAALPIRELS
jgi:hypothetical protein